MLELVNRAASNGVNMASMQYLETTARERFSCEAAVDDKSKCFERWSRSDKIMNDFVMEFVFNALFIQPVAMLIKQRVA